MNDFTRVAAAVPAVRPADVAGNCASVLDVLARARELRADAVCLPELCLTGYTCADLFFRGELLDAAEEALARVIAAEAGERRLVAVGLPVRATGRVFNCAAVIAGGRLAGVVPKSYLPGTREFYESRWFATAREAAEDTVVLAGERVPFGNDLVFGDGCRAYGVEICEDMWTVNPPSTRLALRGANVLLNLSASNELIGKTEYRRSLVAGQSARCLAAYVYAGAGCGESSTDLVFGGHALIAENGAVLAESERFARSAQVLAADVDTGFLEFERRGDYAFRGAAETVAPVRKIAIPESGGAQGKLLRAVDPHPFVPAEAASREARCAEILAIQSTGLATRLEAIGCRHAVVGISGGLDSALALLATVAAFDRLGYGRGGIHPVTMPGFGTTARTRGNAVELCAGLGLELETVDVCDLSARHLASIGHDGRTPDVTYENAQARVRTLTLMDLANRLGGIVVGTGDLSELALGWCTYNGDHMSMYGVNAGVPKTLVRYLVASCADRLAAAGDAPSARAAAALRDILATPVSPELVPANADGTIAQKTEDRVGPYELHDFFLYHYLRRGAGAEKILRLAAEAFDGVYGRREIAGWFDVFERRFYAQQFKRNCMPDGPKVGSVSLSPRGDWRMPSDAVCPRRDRERS